MRETNVMKGRIEMAGLATGIMLIGYDIGLELANTGIITVL